MIVKLALVGDLSRLTAADLPMIGAVLETDAEGARALGTLLGKTVEVVEVRPPRVRDYVNEPAVATLGQYIRAMRLGYHWWGRIQRFVRISDARVGDGIVLDIATGAALKAARGEIKAGLHRCWWEDSPATLAEGLTSDEMLMRSSFLRSLAETVADGGSIPDLRRYELTDDGDARPGRIP